MPLATTDRGRMQRALRAEIRKAWVLRSTWIALVAAAVITIIVATVVSSSRQAVMAHIGSATSKTRSTDLITASTGSLFMTQVPIGLLGVLTIGGEFSTGAIRSTLLGIPNRAHLFLSKILVMLLLVFTMSEAIMFLALGVSEVALRDIANEAGIRDWQVVRSAIGGGIYLALICILGVSIGGICRSSVRGIVTLLVLLLIVPTFVNLLPERASQVITRYLPTEAGLEMTRATATPGDLRYVTGGAVLLLWTVMALAIAAWRIADSDL